MPSLICAICHADQANVAIVKCESGGHTVCLGCFKKDITTRVAVQNPSLGCFGHPACSSYFSDSNAYQLLSPFPELARQHILLKRGLATLPNFRQCAFCDWGIEIDYPEDVKVLRCKHPECGKKTCMKCRKEGHGWQSCAKAAAKANTPAVGVAPAMSEVNAPAQAQAETASVAGSEAGTCSTLVDDESIADQHGGGYFSCFGRKRRARARRERHQRIARAFKSMFGKKSPAPEAEFGEKPFQKAY